MDENERIVADCRATWHEEAHKTAVIEADQKGFQGAKREDFIKARQAERYAELEKLGMENLEEDTCYCTQRFCNHANALRCGKPLSAKTMTDWQREKQFEGHSLPLCDECADNSRKYQKQFA
jgi:hypothetical protein